MILGLGTDIAEIQRVKRVYESKGEGFIDRILTSQEKESMPNKEEKIPSYLAKRFVVKEAAAKALGTGIGNGVSFHDFTLEHTELGAPILLISGSASEIASEKGITQWHVSLSDEVNYAVATVIAEK